MNETIESKIPFGTVGAIVIGLTSVAASDNPADWPANISPVYSGIESSSSYSSFIDQSLKLSPNALDSEFAYGIAGIYEELCTNQESLGAEFEAIWDENIDDLYEV